MNLAARAAVAFALLCILGVFLPAGRLTVGGRLATHHASRSMFQLGRSQDAVQDFLAKYRKSTAKKIGSKALDKVAPHLSGRARSAASDVQDAVATLDELRDEDIRTVGTLTAATMWGLLALNLLLIVLVYGVNAGTSRLRIAGAVAVSLVVAVLGVALLLVLRFVVAEANAEIGRPLLALRGGVYVIAFAAAASAIAVLALLIAYVGRRRALRA